MPRISRDLALRSLVICVVNPKRIQHPIPYPIPAVSTKKVRFVRHY